MIEKIIQEGEHIAYTTTKKSVTFGDEDLTVNLKNRERDDEVTVDICSDIDGNLVVGADADGSRKYVAQVTIPAREYTYEEKDNPDYDKKAKEGPTAQKTITTKNPVDFDINKCTIALWAI